MEIVMGTMSKALGSVGGYIAGSRPLIDWLVNRARSFIYSTALPPGAITASDAAVQLAESAEGDALRSKLRANVTLFRECLPAALRPKVEGAIQPVLCGESAAALKMAANLRMRGFLIPAIRYPTVARNAARLRITLSAAHETGAIRGLALALEALAAKRQRRVKASDKSGPLCLNADA